jgi:hypothetical protein
MARAMTTPTVMNEARPYRPMRSFMRWVSGIVSVGLYALWLVKET